MIQVLVLERFASSLLCLPPRPALGCAGLVGIGGFCHSEYKKLIAQLEEERDQVVIKRDALVAEIGNIVHESVPVGSAKEEVLVIRLCCDS